MPAYNVNTDEVKAVADKLIATQPDLELTKMLKIAYIFRPEAPVSNGRVVFGMCCRVDDRNWALHKNDFLIEISKDMWDDASEEFRVALVHHELKHAGIRLDKTGQPAIDESSGRLKTYCVPHEIEEFQVILDTYGTYHAGLRAFLHNWTEKKTAPKEKTEKSTTTKPAAGSDDGDPLELE